MATRDHDKQAQPILTDEEITSLNEAIESLERENIESCHFCTRTTNLVLFYGIHICLPCVQELNNEVERSILYNRLVQSDKRPS
jgi:hypothetical protein